MQFSNRAMISCELYLHELHMRKGSPGSTNKAARQAFHLNYESITKRLYAHCKDKVIHKRLFRRCWMTFLQK